MKRIIIIMVAAGLIVLALYLMVMGMQVEQERQPIPEASISADVASPVQLEQKAWEWVETVDGAGTTVVPRETGIFTVSFDGESVRISTDCNTGVATYTATERELSFSAIGSTKMYCEGSQELEFFAMLKEVASYRITDEGQLILYLRFDSGSIILQ